MGPRTLWIAIFFQSTLTFGQVSLDGIGLQNGAYAVGFYHYTALDSTRTYKRVFDWRNRQLPRQLPISVWYPSTAIGNGLKTMLVMDYMEVLKEEEEWEHLPNDQILNWFYYPNTPENRSHLLEQTNAYHQTPPLAGTFPVVLYAPSYQASSIENFRICEYLASHGYIVIAAASRGTANRFFEGGTEKDMETQARDIEYILKEASKIPNTNLELIATMGFSFGGLSNVLTQMRNENIKAIVSLDGSIKYQYQTLLKSPFAAMDNVNVPFIHMAQKDIPAVVLNEDNIDPALNHQFEFFDNLRYSQAYSLKFHDLTHSHFSTLGVLFQPRDSRQDKTDPEIMKSYQLVATYTLNFLNAFLKNNTQAMSFLNQQPEKNGVDKGLISHRIKTPEPKPFSFQDFNELAFAQEYANLEKLYTAIVAEHPSFSLPEGSLNNLGLQLVFNPKTSLKGIRILLLATKVYPESSNLYDSLAEAYLFTGDTKRAITNFKKSLELDSQNQNAIDRLAKLEK